MKDYLGYQLKTDGTEVVKIFVLGHRTACSLLVPLLVVHTTPPTLLSSLNKVSIILMLMQLSMRPTCSNLLLFIEGSSPPPPFSAILSPFPCLLSYDLVWLTCSVRLISESERDLNQAGAIPVGSRKRFLVSRRSQLPPTKLALLQLVFTSTTYRISSQLR